MQPKLCVKALLMLACLFSLTVPHAQTGSLDRSFGDGGMIKQRFLQNANTFNETALGIITQEDGHYLVPLFVNNSTLMMRLTPSGALDTSYGNRGYSDYIRMQSVSMVPAPDGGFFIAGRYSNSIAVARYDADGRVVKSFGKDGLAITAFRTTPGNIKDLVLQPDGKIVVVGEWYNGINFDLVLCRFHSDGSVDAAFGQQGLAYSDLGASEVAMAAALQPDGKILVTGGFTTANLFNNMGLARFNADGSLDLSFGNGGKILAGLGISQSAYDVQVQPDGKILVTGGNIDFFLLRYLTNGVPDASFGNNGVAMSNFFAANEIPRSIQLLEDGRIIVAGDIRFSSTKGEFGLAAFLPNGFIDQSFGFSGRFTTTTTHAVSSVIGLARQPDGKYMIAGAVQAVNQPRDYAVLRFEALGKPDVSFGSVGIMTGFYDGESTNFRSLAVQEDGRIVAGGSTVRPTGPRFSLARYHADGTPDISFGIEGRLMAELGGNTSFGDLAVYRDGRILAAGNFSGPGIADFVLARFLPDGSLDASFGAGGKILSSFSTGPDNLLAVAFQDDRILAGGTTTPASPGFPVYVLARYLPDGTLDRSFGVNGAIINNFGYAGSILASIKVLEDGKILTLARGTNPNNQFDIILAKFLPDGMPDASFGNGGVATVNYSLMDNGMAMELTAEGKIVVAGYFHNIINGADVRAGLVRFNADGTVDASFGENGRVLNEVGLRSQASTLSIDAEGRMIIGGPVSTDQPKSMVFLSRYLPDGTLDPSFGQNGTSLPELPHDAAANRSVIYGDRLFVAGLLAEITTYGSIASYVLSQPVKLACPANTRQVADSICIAMVTGIDPVLTPEGASANVYYSLSGAMNATGGGSVNGFGFPKGITTVQYSLDSSRTCSFIVTVVDSTAPVLSGLSVSTTTLWPVNRQMREVQVPYSATDNCGPVNLSLSVTTNEEGVQPGNGNASPDWEIVNDHLVRLKAERLGNGEGRVYTIQVTAVDETGNSTTDSVTVRVPKDQSSVVSAERVAEGSLEKKNSLGLSVLSNPSATEFSLRISGAENGKPMTLKVTDATGRIVEVRNNVSPGAALQVGKQYRRGIYFVQVMQGGQLVRMKLVKQ